MTDKKLHHVGIAVASIDDTIDTWAMLTGSAGYGREIVDSQGVEVIFLGEGPGRVELLAPTGPESSVARFLERRGSGVHHICYQVPDIALALTEMIEAGFEPIDREPRVGAHGHLVAFLHPRSTGGVLYELLEDRSSAG